MSTPHDDPTKPEASGARPTRPTEPLPLSDENARYDVESDPIAIGGMGAVWRAFDRDLERKIAVKSLRTALVGDRGAYERLARETRILSTLAHPGICPIFDRYLLSDPPCYTMQFVDGVTLKTAIEEFHAHGSADLEELRRLVTSLVAIANTVAYAHGRGILHRDLKPDNILLGSFGEVYVMDWGIASAPDASEVEPIEAPDEGLVGLSVSGDVLGTPSYMSPEQARGDLDALDERTDVFGVGAILFEILVGDPPFDRTMPLSEDALAPIAARLDGLDRRLPQDLAACCLRALRFRPEDRYASVLAMREDLDRFLAGRMVEAASYTTWQALGKWVRRNRKAVVPTAIVGLIAAIVLVVGLVSYIDRIETARRDTESTLADSLVAQGALLVDKQRSQLALEKLERACELRMDLGEPDLPARLYRADALRSETRPVVHWQDPRVEDIGGWAAVLLDPSEQRVFCAQVGKGIVVHDLLSGAVLRTLETSGQVTSLKFSSSLDRLWALVPTRNRIESLDLDSGDCRDFVAVPSETRVFDVADDESLVAFGSGTPTKVSIVHCESPHEIVCRFDALIAVDNLELGPAGERILVSGYGGYNAAMFDIPQAERRWQVGVGTGSSALFHGDRVIVSGSRTLRVIDDGAKKIVQTIGPQPAGMANCAGDPRGHFVVGVATDGIVHVLGSDGQTKRLFAESDLGEQVEVCVDAFGRITVANRANRSVFTWEPNGDAAIRCDVGSSIGAIAITPDADLLVTAGRELCVLDAVTGIVLARRDLHDGKGNRSLAIAPDGRELVVSIQGGRAEQVRIDTLEPVRELSRGRSGCACGAGYSPSGDEIVVARSDGTFAVHRRETGEVRLEADTDSVLWSASFTPDGRHIVSTSHRRERKAPIALWDRSSGELIGQFSCATGMDSPVYQARFDAHGNVFAGRHDGTVLLGTIESRQLSEVKSQSHPIMDLAVDASGDWLVARGYVGDCRLLHTRTHLQGWEFANEHESICITQFVHGPGHFFAGTSRGEVYELDGDYANRFRQEVETARRAGTSLRSDPNDTDALLAMASWCAFRKAWQTASDYYQRAIARGARPQGFGMMMAEWTRGEHSAALAQVEHALELDEISATKAVLLRAAIGR